MLPDLLHEFLFFEIFNVAFKILIIFYSIFFIADHNRLVGPTPTPNTTTAKSPSSNNSPRSSTRSTNQTTQPSNRNGTIILENLSISPKSSCKQNDIENNNSSKIVNKNSNNAKKSPQAQRSLAMEQQLLDQQMHEKKMVDLNNLVHANKGVEALGVLVQYLVFNVSIFYIF